MKRSPQSFSVSRVSATALAVGTGIGVGSMADAAIVYTDIPNVLVDNNSFALDLDNNGIDDFTFSHTFSPQGYIPGYYGPGYTDPYTGNYYQGLYYPGQPIPNFGNSDVRGSASNGIADVYPAMGVGEVVNASSVFNTAMNIGAVDYYNDVGNWPFGTEGYLGLQFDIDGQVHYGWAHLGLDFFETTITLYDFAYESTPGAAVTTGAVPIPGMAPLLGIATGAMGVLGFRRRRRQGQPQKVTA